MVLSTQSKRGNCILGRISAVFPGNERLYDHVRVAKVRIGDQNTFDRYLNCAPLSAKDLKNLINQNLSKKGRIIIRKYKKNGNETLHKRTYKQTKFQ